VSYAGSAVPLRSVTGFAVVASLTSGRSEVRDNCVDWNLCSLVLRTLALGVDRLKVVGPANEGEINSAKKKKRRAVFMRRARNIAKTQSRWKMSENVRGTRVFKLANDQVY